MDGTCLLIYSPHASLTNILFHLSTKDLVMNQCSVSRGW